MPHLEGMGRLIACDLVGMGRLWQTSRFGPGAGTTFQEQREYLFRLWDMLGIDGNVLFVLHDQGWALGFNWAYQHQDLVSGIAYMESIVMPQVWDDWSNEGIKKMFQGFRSPAGETMVLQDNMFVERVLSASMLWDLADEEMAVYRAPYVEPGESRRPTLTWPRQLPIEDEPADVVQIVGEYSSWLAESHVPKLFINGDPGILTTGRHRDFCRTWPNQTGITVAWLHFLQEDAPDLIGAALADFVRAVRGR